MAAPGPTYATFANTLVSKGFDFTFAPGVQPSVCMLYTVPHVANLPSVGTLTIKTDGGQTWTFRDCLVEDPKLSTGTGGKYVTLPVKDRRWRWQFHTISGHYNKPRKNGTYRDERKPQELADLLLQLLGETGFDVSRLPNDARPERRWDATDVASALDELCAELGCIVVLNPATDAVEIWPVGQGQTLPAGGAIGRASTPVKKATPNFMRAVAAPTLFQATWECEAVGLDTDGQWKPLTQLSYAFGTGFSGSAALNGFEGYWENQTYVQDGKTLNVRDLAAATVFKSYRVKAVKGWDKGIKPPGSDLLFPIDDFDDIFFQDRLAEDELDPVTGGLRPVPSVVYARYARLDRRLPDAPVRYEHGFSFDPETRILSFSEPLFIYGGATAWSQPAAVYFETSFFAGWQAVPERHQIDVSVDPSSKGHTTTVVESVQRRIVYYSNTTGNIFGKSDNKTEVETKLKYYLDAEVAEFQLVNGGTITYNGLLPLSPDGNTMQITWSGGGGRPATTTVSQAQRHNRYIPPLDEYREKLAVKRMEAVTNQLVVGQLTRLIGGGI